MDQIAPAAPGATRPRVITVLGATGSIGRSTAEILCGAPEQFTVAAVERPMEPVEPRTARCFTEDIFADRHRTVVGRRAGQG